MLIDAFKYNTLILRLLKKLPCSAHSARVHHGYVVFWHVAPHCSYVTALVICLWFPLQMCFQRSHLVVPYSAVPVPRIIADLESNFSIYAGLSQLRREASAFCLCSDCATGTCLPPSVFFSADIDTETMNEWHAWIMWWLGWLGVILERSILSRSLWQRL